MNWAEQHIQQIETPKTKTKEYIEWGLKLLFTAMSSPLYSPIEFWFL